MTELEEENRRLHQRIEELERSRALGGPSWQLEQMLDFMQEGLQIFDLQWRYVYLNRAAAEHGRRKPEDYSGRTLLDMYPGVENTPMFAQLEKSMRERTSARFDNHFTFPDGQTGWFELRVEPVPEGILLVSVDISQRLQLEAELAHSQKMEALGRLAGGIAHDFNNLLTVILSYASFLAETHAPESEVSEDARQIVAAAQRGASLTQQLLALGRRQVLDVQVLDASSILRDLLPMLQRLAGSDIQVHLRATESDLKISVDASQLDQVLLNLVANARDAISSSGSITIGCSSTRFEQAYTDKKVDLEPGDYVMISVTDTGKGMDEALLSHIFEPFFTTKGPGHGTGLGLATSHGIVRQNRGHIWVYSEPGHGTTFKLYFPRVDARVSSGLEAPSDIHPAASLRGSETVLVVDNEDALRFACVRSLQSFGYRVLDAKGPREALEQLAQHPQEIGAILADVVMPETDGPAMVEEILLRHPTMRILFMSGYVDSRLQDTLRHHAYIEKPFTAEALARRLRQILGPVSGHT